MQRLRGLDAEAAANLAPMGLSKEALERLPLGAAIWAKHSAEAEARSARVGRAMEWQGEGPPCLTRSTPCPHQSSQAASHSLAASRSRKEQITTLDDRQALIEPECRARQWRDMIHGPTADACRHGKRRPFQRGAIEFSSTYSTHHPRAG
jgi:hypothetical protein